MPTKLEGSDMRRQSLTRAIVSPHKLFTFKHKKFLQPDTCLSEKRQESKAVCNLSKFKSSPMKFFGAQQDNSSRQTCQKELAFTVNEPKLATNFLIREEEAGINSSILSNSLDSDDDSEIENVPPATRGFNSGFRALQVPTRQLKENSFSRYFADLEHFDEDGELEPIPQKLLDASSSSSKLEFLKEVDKVFETSQPSQATLNFR